jgi:hypothetical protein
MIDDHTPQTMAMQQLQGSGAGQMNDLVKRLRGSTINIGLVHEAADRIDTMETMLQAMADGRIVMLARIEALEEQVAFWEVQIGIQMERNEKLEAALREIMTNKDEDHWEVNRIARAALAQPAQPLTTFTQPAAWRVDGIRDGVERVWFYWKPEWPDMHAKEGDKVTPLYTSPLAPPAQPLTTDTIDLANPLPGDPPIQQQPNSAVFPGFRGNNEA